MDFPSFIVDVDCRVNWKPGDLVRIKHDIGLLPWLLGESLDRSHLVRVRAKRNLEKFGAASQ
jgi:hypothetical protein